MLKKGNKHVNDNSDRAVLLKFTSFFIFSHFFENRCDIARTLSRTDPRSIVVRP